MTLLIRVSKGVLGIQIPMQSVYNLFSTHYLFTKAVNISLSGLPVTVPGMDIFMMISSPF